MTSVLSPSAAELIVISQITNYNLQNLSKFLSCFTPNIIISTLNGSLVSPTKEEMTINFKKLFANYPTNKAIITNRMVLE